MHSVLVLVQYLRVNDLKREWWIDLPELTSIRLGWYAFLFKDNESSELIMRSGDDEMKWWIDLPKLTTLTTTEGDNSRIFLYPRSITLEGVSYHSILTNRYALSSHHFSSMGFLLHENPPHEEFLSLLSLIPRHHSRSFWLPLLSSFFHTLFTINSLQMSHSHFTTLSIITPHWPTIPSRGMCEDVPFHHSPDTCSISLLNSTNHTILTH